MNTMLSRLTMLALFTACGIALADEPADRQVALKDGDRIIFFGDSLTYLAGKEEPKDKVMKGYVRIVKEKIADYIDPPRVYPLIGPAQLHHAHYKCTIYYTEITRVGWPVPYTYTDEDAVEVIYIDHNHFHMVGDPDFGCNSNY